MAPDDESVGESSAERADRVRAIARQALQVAVATTAAIVVGELLSPTRWYWAVIAAFVVFTGTTTRGETLSKGAQRVAGTLAGVAAGVVVAALVAGNTVAAVAGIAACLFGGFYLMKLSSAIMVFFTTTMLALLYGLLGQFSIGLLALRLEETAAGAAIGVLVSYLVAPASTGAAFGAAQVRFLRELGGLLTHSGAALTATDQPWAGPAAPTGARALRDSFAAARTAAKPLTDGLAGLTGRSGTRDTIAILAACDHHARALARLADLGPATITTPELRAAMAAALRRVGDNVDALADRVERPSSALLVYPVDEALDAVEDTTSAGPGHDGPRLLAAVRHLRVIDQAICRLAPDLGAMQDPPDRAAAARPAHQISTLSTPPP